MASIREPVAQVAGGATSVHLLVASPLNEIVVATCWQSISMVFVLISKRFSWDFSYIVCHEDVQSVVLVSACNCQYVGFCWVWFLNGVIENHIKERF